MSISCAGNCDDHSSIRFQIVSPEPSYSCLHAVLVAVPVLYVDTRSAACIVHFVHGLDMQC